MLSNPWKGKQQNLQGGTSPSAHGWRCTPSPPMDEMICCPLLSLFLGLAEGGYFALNTRLVLKASGSATDLPCAQTEHCTSPFLHAKCRRLHPILCHLWSQCKTTVKGLSCGDSPDGLIPNRPWKCCWD